MDSSAGSRCWDALRIAFRIALIGVIAFCATACQRQAADAAAEKPRPQQAGQPINRYAAAGHIAGARAALAAGNSQAAQQHVDVMARDFSRSIRLRDVNRPINHEAARATVRPMPGVLRAESYRWLSIHVHVRTS